VVDCAGVYVGAFAAVASDEGEPEVAEVSVDEVVTVVVVVMSPTRISMHRTPDLMPAALVTCEWTITVEAMVLVMVMVVDTAVALMLSLVSKLWSET
jgi:hypothetical protein